MVSYETFHCYVVTDTIMVMMLRIFCGRGHGNDYIPNDLIVLFLYLSVDCVRFM